MDRVLLVIDQLQFSGHLESTLRKIGYTTESLQSEFSVHEKILGFNPDVIIIRGTGQRINTPVLTKKMKDQFRYHGQIIVVYPDTDTLDVDIQLQEPASALKIAMSLILLENNANEQTQKKERLLKMSQTDGHFIKEEQAYLVKFAVDFTQELHHVEKLSLKPKQTLTAVKQKIELYNKQIDSLDIDLKKGLNKRQTKAKSNRGLITEAAKEIDNERKNYVEALFKKEK